MKRCYISGAIEHHDIDERKKAFAEAEFFLESCGMEAVNPFKNSLWSAGKGDAHWREHMRVDILDLLSCDAIYMLQGWWLSKGAKLELDVASSCGLDIMFEQ